MVLKQPSISRNKQDEVHERIEMTDHRSYPRREVLKLGGLGLISRSFAPLLNSFANSQKTFVEPVGTPYQGTDDKLLDEIQRTTFDFFWHEASPKTGQVKDRALANGNDNDTH